MMDGYSVQDAASVLGVPEGRVWELLARGVLAGTPEGDSMRVFLKADAPAPARPAPREALPAGNGNGGSYGAEVSAFRELLTEFRNLTERYGQALLALGEARGEVAGLRSRVELLEVRIDPRLPARMAAEPISWEAPALHAPTLEAPAAEPPVPAKVEAVQPAPAPVPRPPRPRRARSPRAAVAGFAEALARAQDPNLAEVGEAPASVEVEAEAEARGVAASPSVETAPEPVIAAPAQLEAAESAEQGPGAEATYRAAEAEPDWFADGDFSWLDAADLEARSQRHVIAVEVRAAPADVEAEAEPALEPKPALEPIVEANVSSQPEVDAELAPEPEPAIFVASATEPRATAAVGRMEPVEVGGAGEVAAERLGGPSEPADEMEIATAASQKTAPASKGWEPLEPVAWPAGDRRATTTEAVVPPLAMTEDELAQLARDEGWDDAEVAAIRAMISKPASGTVELPGSAELDEAISALQAVPIAPRSDAPAASQWAKAGSTSAETTAHDDWAFEVEPLPSQPPAPQASLVPRRAASDPNWLRRRRGPAASAYRRIRRIFTG